MNSILRSLAAPVLRGGSVLLLSTAYAMVPNTLAWLGPQEDISITRVNISFPLADGARGIVAQVEQTLQAAASGTVRLCVFSHITSVPSLLLPIEELAATCRKHGALVLIDGAHAPGQIAINMTRYAQAGVSFYVGNAHKWLYRCAYSPLTLCVCPLKHAFSGCSAVRRGRRLCGRHPTPSGTLYPR